MKDTLANMLQRLAMGDKEGAATSLSQFLKSKSTKMMESDRQYRKGHYGETQEEDFEAEVDSSYAGMPVKVHFKGVQLAEVAHSTGGRYDPPESEIVEYLDIRAVDVTLKHGDQEEYIFFDIDFQECKDINYIKQQLQQIDEIDSIFGKPLVVDELTKIVHIAVLQIAKTHEDQAA